MVYIPFLKIDIPEPRLQEVIPNTITFLISLFSGALQTANDIINPMTPEEQEAYDKALEDILPRELKDVLAKYDSGAIKDEAKLSSEVEEACYDYYRRTIRTNIAGYSDEDTEDWAERKTRDLRSPRQELLEAYDRQLLSQLAAASQPLAPELESDEARRDPAAFQHYLQQQEAILEAYAAAAQQEREAAAAQQRRRQALPRRLVGVTASGALGMAAGVGIVRLLRMVQRRLAGGAPKPKKAAAKAKAGAAPQKSGAGGKKKASAGGGKAGGQRKRPPQ